MNPAVLVIAVLVLAAVIAAFWLQQQNKTKNVQKTEEELERERIERKKKEDQVCNACYKYLSHTMNRLARLFVRDRIDQQTELDPVPCEVIDNVDIIRRRLGPEEEAWLAGIGSFLRFEKEEEKTRVMVEDPAALKEAYLQEMMPFYRYYHQQFSEGRVRYSSLLSQHMLAVYRKLAGKRFRVGHQNKHNTGVVSFTWDKDRYCVYDKNGVLLCNASFKDGKFYEGYALLPGENEEGSDWSVTRAGEFHEGVFEEKTIRYDYRVKV